MARNRIIYTTIAGGTAGRFVHEPDMSPGDEVTLGSRYCSDHPGPGDCAPLYISVIERAGGVINRNWTSYFENYFRNYVCDWHRSPGNGTTHIPLATMDNYEAAAVAAARTNPSRPEVDLSNYLAELREIPQLLTRLSRNHIRNAADLNLRYQFGVRPLVNDLMQMLNFQQSVKRRMEELRRIRDTRHLRRTVRLQEMKGTYSYDAAVQSVHGYLPMTMNQSTTETVWAHTRWTQNTDLLLGASDDRLRSLAAQAVGGMTSDISTAWNLMPWTWLIDWYTNCGDVLAARRNLLGVTLDGVAVMRRKRTITTCSSYGPDWHGTTMSGISCRYEEKMRSTVPVTLSASMPILNNRQWGILGSISVTRR